MRKLPLNDYLCELDRIARDADGSAGFGPPWIATRAPAPSTHGRIDRAGIIGHDAPDR